MKNYRLRPNIFVERLGEIPTTKATFALEILFRCEDDATARGMALEYLQGYKNGTLGHAHGTPVLEEVLVLHFRVDILVATGTITPERLRPSKRKPPFTSYLGIRKIPLA